MNCATAACDVSLVTVATLADSPPRLLPDYSVFVSRGAAGQFVTVSRSRDQIVVFDSGGQHLRSLGGVAGQQPLEVLRIARVIHGPRGEVLVHDLGSRRLTILDAAHTVRGTVPLANSPSLVLPDTGHILVAAQIPTGDLIGYPLHVFDRSGDVVRSFGTDVPEFRQDRALLMTRHGTYATGGLIWSIAPGRYVLEKWDPATGARVDRVTVQSSWFEESARLQDASVVRPTPLVEMIWYDEPIVWALSRDADANWRPRPERGVERAFDPDEYDATFDWVIEAIDATSGAVLASRRVDKALWGHSSSPLLTTRRAVDGSDRVEFDVLEPRLERKEAVTSARPSAHSRGGLCSSAPHCA